MCNYCVTIVDLYSHEHLLNKELKVKCEYHIDNEQKELFHDTTVFCDLHIRCVIESIRTYKVWYRMHLNKATCLFYN